MNNFPSVAILDPKRQSLFQVQPKHTHYIAVRNRGKRLALNLEGSFKTFWPRGFNPASSRSSRCCNMAQESARLVAGNRGKSISNEPGKRSLAGYVSLLVTIFRLLNLLAP